MEPKPRLDDIDRLLIGELQRDARSSYAHLGRLTGLSAPAAAERVRRLEDVGVFLGYRARVDRVLLGYGLTAFIRLKVPSGLYPRIDALAEEMPEILECHHVTGEDGFIIKLIARDVTHLDELIARIAPFAATTSSIVLSTRLEGKPIAP